MRRVNSQRPSPSKLNINGCFHDLNFINSLEIKSAANGNPVKQVDNTRNNESTLISTSNKSVREIKGIVKELQEENKKLLIENICAKEENSLLVKIYKEYQATSIEQQKSIGRLNVEISKLSQYFYRASNEIGGGRYSKYPFGGKIKSEEAAKKTEKLSIWRNSSVDRIVNKRKFR